MAMTYAQQEMAYTNKLKVFLSHIGLPRNFFMLTDVSVIYYGFLILCFYGIYVCANVYLCVCMCLVFLVLFLFVCFILFWLVFKFSIIKLNLIKIFSIFLCSNEKGRKEWCGCK